VTICDTNGTRRVLRVVPARAAAPPEFQLWAALRTKQRAWPITIGKAKQAIGKAVGNDRLVVKGAAQEAENKARKAVGDAKSAVKDGVNKVAGKINQNL
jgi:uncharacterized protein YjbJ (UPF0337 family)